MSGTGAFVWFVVTTVSFFAMITFGTWLAVHTYDRGRGVVDFQVRQHRHG